MASSARMGGDHWQAREIIVVSGGVQEAEVLNGTYEQIGSYCDRPHFSKEGLPYDVPRHGFKENLQIWWHDGEWRIGTQGDHWCALVHRPPGVRAFGRPAGAETPACRSACSSHVAFRRRGRSATSGGVLRARAVPRASGQRCCWR